MHGLRLLHSRFLELLALGGALVALEWRELDRLASAGRLQNRADHPHIGEALDSGWFRVAVA
jgi:hypothetical protein